MDLKFWIQFSSIFWKKQHHFQKITSNLLRITLRSRLRVSNEWSIEEAIYTQTYGNILGGIPQNVVFANFSKYWWLAKTIHTAFRIHKTLYTKPIREICNFHYLPKLYVGFRNEDNFQNLFIFPSDIICQLLPWQPVSNSNFGPLLQHSWITMEIELVNKLHIV